MRILMLSQFYPPIVGGIEQHVRNLSAGLVARGHHVAVATLYQDGLPAVETDGGVRIYRIRGMLQRAGWLFTEKRRHAPPFPDPGLVAGLAQVIKTERPDVVHGHNWLARSFLPLKAWSKAPLVLTQHDYGRVCATHRFVNHQAACRGAGRRCLPCAAAHYGVLRGVPITLANWATAKAEQSSVAMFMPVSSAVASATDLAAHSLPFQVIPNFVPDDVATVENRETLENIELPAGEFLLFVGDVSREKGVDVLFQAHAQLSHSLPLVLIGRRTAGIADELGKNVLWIPPLPHDAVMRIWTKSAIGLAPSVMPDPCPTVAMEAMAAGKPVIASRIGGLDDIVSDEETGLFVPSGDVDKLRAAMERLIGDRDLRLRMGKAGRQRVRRFQAAQVIPQVVQVYTKVTEEARSST